MVKLGAGVRRWLRRRGKAGSLTVPGGDGVRAAGDSDGPPSESPAPPSPEDLWKYLKVVPSPLRFRARCLLIKSAPEYDHVNRETLRGIAKATRRHNDGRAKGERAA